MLLSAKQIARIYNYSEANARPLLARAEVAKYVVNNVRTKPRGSARLLYEFNPTSAPAFDYVFALKGYNRTKTLKEILSDV